MNHSYYLGRMQQGLKEKIEAESVYAGWIKQGLTLEHIWRDAAMMKVVYDQLSARERQVLLLLVTSIGCEPFDWVKLERLASASMSGAEAKVGFLLLLKKGLLHTFRKSWGEHLYVMAHDAMALWQQIVWAHEDRELLIVSREDEASQSIEQSDASGVGLAHALFQSMVYISDNELKLTKNGTLHKRQLQKWAELLPLHEEWLRGCGIQYAYADVYPVSVAVVWDVLARLEVLEQGPEAIVLQEEGAKRWLLLSEAEQNKQLYAMWKQVVFPAESWLQHMVLLLERQPEAVWLKADGILQWLRKHGMAVEAPMMDDEQRLRQMEERWLLPLLAFGWIEKGQGSADEGSALLYRWRKHPLADVRLEDLAAPAAPEAAEAMETSEAAGGCLYVQPDFEVLVPPDAAFAVRWELSAIADHLHSDSMSVYIISKESLQRGLENGRRIDQIIAFLEQHAIYGIPENVKMTLAQWAKPFGKVRLVQALLLRCEDIEVAKAVNKLPGVADCLLEPIGQQAWLIQAERLESLTALLDKAGWMTGNLVIMDGSESSGKLLHRPIMIEAELLAERETERWPQSQLQSQLQLQTRLQQKAGNGFIYSRQPFVHFEMELLLPAVEELYPNLKEVPTAWMKEYRLYHPTTRKEIVEKAIEWKTLLQIRIDGADHVLVPAKLQETRGTWSVTGLEEQQRKEICLFPGDWQEMRIILPGIYEK
jgi:hypothetical protein